MGFAGVIMIFFASLMDGMLQASERNATMMNTSELQLHAKTYLDDPDHYTVMHDEEALLEKLATVGAGASPRLFAFVLAASPSPQPLWLILLLCWLMSLPQT